MSKKLNSTVRAYLCEDNILKRYIRIEEASKLYEIDSESIKVIAFAAGAIYQLSRTTLFNHMKMEEYMRCKFFWGNDSRCINSNYQKYK